MFDYLVVGSGLYGAVFAHEANAHGKSVLVVDKRPNIAGNIYTERILKVSTSTSMVPIFSIPTIKKCGTTSRTSQSLTASRTPPWPTTRASFTRCPSICTPLIRCGEL